jgi:hypothetical protein
MTSEIAILNSSAVALATDSAVTINFGDKQKIYNSVNKLFALNYEFPVGIMSYGNAEFMGIPWESIIKVFRKKLINLELNTLNDYVDLFIDFLVSDSNVVLEEMKDIHFKYYLNMMMVEIIPIYNEEVKRLSICEKITKYKKKKIFAQLTQDYLNYCESEFEDMNIFTENEIRRFLNNKRQIMDSYFNDIHSFGIPFFIYTKKVIEKIIIKHICKDFWSPRRSGLVFTGFGKNDIYPKLVQVIIDEIIINNKLKMKNGIREISPDKRAIIIPFAQGEQDVYLFMEGIDPELQNEYNEYIKTITTKYPTQILRQLGLPRNQSRILSENLKRFGERILSDFNQHMKGYRWEKHSFPVIEATQYLPKNELAIMAETLVNLSSFKRKMRADIDETVGEPIDVAILSKGDGFIWIKRKHYFQKDLNPKFIVRSNR